jgi:hypothetical protein
LIDDVLEDIPEFDQNFEKNIKLLELIKEEIIIVSKTKDVKLKEKIEKDLIEIVDGIQKTEEFVKNLDNDISEWGAFDKLIKRDK